MTKSALFCKDEMRRQQVRRKRLNGLDYLEVSDDQLILTVYFLGKAHRNISKENIRITGGTRITDIKVIGLKLNLQDDSELDDNLEITVDKYGDFSTYTLSIVESGTNELRADFDPRYAQLDFSFKVGCPQDLDCKPQIAAQPIQYVEPEINYLAKDYDSFRQLILDRLSLTMPDWQERHVPDIGITLIEILAYIGDYLSYYQDAVATEAYLETARQRISIRRHVRLMDYFLHEGCNSRAWVYIKTDQDIIKPLNSDDIYFVTKFPGNPNEGTILKEKDLHNIPRSSYEVFEPLIEDEEQKDTILYKAHNQISFYTWGNQQCCLPTGTTSATLEDEWAPQENPPSTEQNQTKQLDQKTDSNTTSNNISVPIAEHEPKLHLKKGDVLIFEEIKGPKTGHSKDANPTHRHAVLLRDVKSGIDKLNNKPIIEIEWAEEDALPFSLCLSSIGGEDCRLITDVSIARGNVILVDHGEKIREEQIGTVSTKEIKTRCEKIGHPPNKFIMPNKFEPILKRNPVTFRQPIIYKKSASTILVQDPHKAIPQIELKDNSNTSDNPTWSPRIDLIESSSQDQHFVVEIDNEGCAHLRFGDDQLGRMPNAESTFIANYRIGNGPAGNVGADTIAYIVLRSDISGLGTLTPHNPLPAQGGISPEGLVEAKMLAPYAFRNDLKRAIIPNDYVILAQKHPKVQPAVSTLRWTGSWYEMLVTIDQKNKTGANKNVLSEIDKYLHRYRRIGHDVIVKAANYVPLDIVLKVCVLPQYLQAHVKAALLDTFSNKILSDGRLGFFHPDNLTFGEGIYMSKIIALAQSVPGVESLTVTKFERLFEGSNHEIENGILKLGPLEIARLDNDPTYPENGQLKIEVGGGR